MEEDTKPEVTIKLRDENKFYITKIILYEKHYMYTFSDKKF